jgi:tape measure domain-containing protein
MGVEFNVTTAHKSTGADRVVSDTKKITEATKASTRAQQQARDAQGKFTKSQEGGASKARLMIRRQETINKLMKEQGVTFKAASAVVRSFGRDMDLAGKKSATLARKLDAAQKETAELTRAQRDASGASRGLVSGLKSAVIGTAAFAAGMVAARKAIAGIGEAVDAAIQLDKIERGLTIAKGSAEAGAEALAFVRSEAERLGVSLPQTAEAFSQLANATRNNAQLAAATEEIFTAVAEASVVLGKSQEETAGILRAFGQVAAKGKFQMEEVLQVAERGVPIFGLLENALGVTGNELATMFQKGEVGADALIPLAQQMRKEFAPGVADAVNSAAASFARFETATFEAKSTLGQLILDEGGLQDMVNVLNLVLKGANDTSGGVKETSITMGAFGDSVRSAGFALVAAELALGTAKSTTQEFLDVLSDMVPTAGIAAEVFREWGSASEGLGEETKIVARIFERFSEERKKSLSFEERLAKLVEEQTKAFKEQERVLKEGKRLTASLTIAEEKLASQTKRAADLFAAGAIDAETFARATDKFVTQPTLDRLAAAAVRIGALRREINAIKGGKIAAIDAELREAFQALATDELLAPFEIPDELFADIDKLDEEYEGVRKTVADIEEQWLLVGKAAFLVADAIGGAFGDMLSGVVKGVFGVRNALKDLRAAQGTGQQLLGGFGLGQAAGELVSGLGISAGPGQASGLLSGVFGALGTLTGLPGAGIIGGILGELVGGLKIFQKGGDDAIASLRLVGGEVEAFARKVEGDLGGPIQRFGDVVAQAFNSIITTFGGTVTGLAELEVKLRQEGDETVFRLVRASKDVAEFATEAEAVAAALKILLKESDIEGLTENVRSAIKATTAATFEELARDLQLAFQVDQRLLSAGERFLAERVRLLREEIAATSALGISQQDVIDGRIAEENALNRMAESQALQLAGVPDALAAGLAQFDLLREQAAQTEALNQAHQDAAAAASAAASATTTASERWGRDFDEIGRVIGLGGRDLEELRDRIGDLGLEGRIFGESLEIVAGEIEGIDLSLLEAAAEAFQAGQTAGFFRQVAEFTGDARLAAQALELEHRMRVIQLRLTLEEFGARGLLSRAQEERIRLLLAEQEALGFVAPGPGAQPRPGGGRALAGGRGGARRQAAEDFRDAVARVRAELAGATPAQLDWADTIRATRERAAEAGIGVGELNRALADMAALDLQALAMDWSELGRALRQTEIAQARRELVRAAQEGLGEARAQAEADPQGAAAAIAEIRKTLARQLGELGREALDSFGDPLRAIRRAGNATRREIEFLVKNMDALGLSASQIAKTVSNSVIPGLLEVAAREAERLGLETEAAAFRAQQAEFQKLIQLAELEVAEALLLAAGALDEAAVKLFADIRGFLAEPSVVDPLREVVEGAAQIGRARGGTLPATAPFTSADATSASNLADTIRDFVRSFQDLDADVFERQARDWLTVFGDLSDELADLLSPERQAAILDVARTLGLAGADDTFEDLTVSALEAARDRFAELVESGLTGFQDELDAAAAAIEAGGLPGVLAAGAEDLLRQFAEPLGALSDPLAELDAQFLDLITALDLLAIAQGEVGASAADLAEAEAIFAARREALAEDQLRGLREIIGQAQADVLARQGPQAQVIAARAAFESAVAGFDPGDPASIAALEEAIVNFRSLVSGFDESLEGFGGFGGVVTAQMQDAIAALAGLLDTETTVTTVGTAPATASGFAATSPTISTLTTTSPTFNVNTSVDLAPVTSEIAALRQEVADLGAAQTSAFDQIAATDSRLADLATPGTPRVM